MRIALIAEDFRAIGGIQELVDNLALQFDAKGHAVTIATTPHVTAGCERLPHATGEIFLVEIPGRKVPGWRHPERFLRQPRATALGEYLARWQPDVVNSHVWTWDKLITVADECQRRALPFVQSLHDSWGRGKLGNKALAALGQAGALTALSAATKSYFTAQTRTAERARVIRGGVDDEAAAAAEPADLGRSYIFCAAQLNLRFKAIDLLIDAFSRLTVDHPAIDLVIAGDGGDRPRLEAQAVRVTPSGRIKFLGVVPRDRLWSLYKGARVFAMPSHQPEGLGLVFLEAMACGTPAIGSDSGGTPEIIRDNETGFLLRGNDPAELAGRLAMILEQPELRARMGCAARAAVARDYSWRAIADQYLDVYKSCTRFPIPRPMPDIRASAGASRPR